MPKPFHFGYTLLGSAHEAHPPRTGNPAVSLNGLVALDRLGRFDLDRDHVQVARQQLPGVLNRLVPPQDGAGPEVHDLCLPLRCSELPPGGADADEDQRRVRVHGTLPSRCRADFQYADVVILQHDLVDVGIDDGGILGSLGHGGSQPCTQTKREQHGKLPLHSSLLMQSEIRILLLG